LLESTDLTVQSARHLRYLRKHFQIVFQDSSSSLNPFYTVEKTLREPYLVHGEPTPNSKELCDALVRVHLPSEILSSQVTELSHGQRQRLSLLRVLTSFPQMKVLLIDEPFSGLDQLAAQAVIDLWKDQAERLVTIVASHDIEWIQGLCNRVHVMRNGSHIETCSDPKQDFHTEYAHKFWQAGLIADRTSLLEFSSTLPTTANKSIASKI
jgi:ABC-type dipeptide/oligopeptide/nickel transport system ATPase subunit